MRTTVEPIHVITLTLTEDDAARILDDLDRRREPSPPGKELVSALMRVTNPHGFIHGSSTNTGSIKINADSF